jgi:hypothetical protein
LIRHWLHELPSDGLEELIEQSAAALWIEERFFKNMGKILGGK